MSHLVKKACALQDVNILLDAAKRLGWLVTEKARAKFYSGYSDICDFVLIPHGEVTDNGDDLIYTIGIKVEDGKINLLYDNAMNSRSVMYGDQEDTCTQRIIGKLKQSYQVVAAKKIAQKKGWRVKEQIQADGKVILKMGVR